jgi:hypothetical protein
MTSKPLRVAGEVDGWCTRCRLVLNHRIVSMKGPKPHQVECLTCRSHHLWRPGAPGERPEAGATAGARARVLTGASTARTPRVTGATRHAQAWEQATGGRSEAAFKAYDVGGRYGEGDLVRHKKFGQGVVTRVIDATKVEVLFRDETRTLAQGLT